MNSSLDKAVRLPRLIPGGINRAAQIEAVAGGKANNTARVARQLGTPVIATGFLGGYTGEFIREQLLNQKVEDGFVGVSGDTRTCLAVLDETSGTVTEILEPGPVVSGQEWSELLGRLLELARGCPYAVLAGSLPPGVPGDAYRLITEYLQANGSKVLLDASGSALQQALLAKPWMVKINEAEATAWAGSDLNVAVHKLRENSEVVVITRGAQAAMLHSPAGSWQAMPPAISVKSAVGSGDAFSAGLMWALLQGRDLPATLQAAVAAGAANAMTLRTGYLEPEAFYRLCAKVQVSELPGR